MKKLLTFVLFIGICNIALAQTEAAKFKNKELANDAFIGKELKDQFKGLDFSKLWTVTESRFVYGFIGDELQRIYIKFIKVTKSSTNTYNVIGKSMVKNNVCGFHGTITITNIRKTKITATGVDDEFKNKDIKGEYRAVGDYNFAESKTLSHSGIFKGSFETDFFIYKNNIIKYDDLEKEADGFDNNQFVGVWTPYNSKTSKPCNWGDYRISNSGDLDGGAGEFSPTDKYLKLGWQNLRDSYGNDAKSKLAQKQEAAKWWK